MSLLGLEGYVGIHHTIFYELLTHLPTRLQAIMLPNLGKTPVYYYLLFLLTYLNGIRRVNHLYPQPKRLVNAFWIFFYVEKLSRKAMPEISEASSTFPDNSHYYIMCRPSPVL